MKSYTAIFANRIIFDRTEPFYQDDLPNFSFGRGHFTEIIASDAKEFHFSKEAFHNLKSNEFHLPTGTAEITERMFVGCKYLKYISIPGGISSVANDAFDGCTALTDIDFGGTVEKWRSFGVTGFFIVHCTDGDCTIEPET